MTLKPSSNPKPVSETTKKYVQTAANWSGKGVTVTKGMASTGQFQNFKISKFQILNVLVCGSHVCMCRDYRPIFYYLFFSLISSGSG